NLLQQTHRPLQRRQAHHRLPRSASGTPFSLAVPWDPITNIISFARGANFVVVSSITLDFDFHKTRGISHVRFKSLMKSLCSFKCKGYLNKSLILLGEIRGADYQHASYQGFTSDNVEDLIPLVMQWIESAIEELIGLGVVNLIVPGDSPKRCFPAYLTMFFL
ncbi:GDSL esterase/lipase At1g28640, partial [Linum perenne]